jgi:hypothetical protein
MISTAYAMHNSPKKSGDVHAASFTRRVVDLPYMAGNMIGIAHAMHDSPETVGDTYAASLTRRADCLPYWRVAL